MAKMSHCLSGKFYFDISMPDEISCYSRYLCSFYTRTNLLGGLKHTRKMTCSWLRLKILFCSIRCNVSPLMNLLEN